MIEDRVEGVTFHLQSAKERMAGEQKIVDVVLNTTVDDWNLWQEVREKLQEGIRIYQGEDFQSAIMGVLKGDNVELNHRMADLNKQTEEIRELTAQQASFSDQEIRILREENETLKARVAVLEEMEAQLSQLMPT